MQNLKSSNNICQHSAERRLELSRSQSNVRRRLSLRASRERCCSPEDIELTSQFLQRLRSGLNNMDDGDTSVRTLYEIAIHSQHPQLVATFLQQEIVRALWGCRPYGLRVIHALCERECAAMEGVLHENLPGLCDMATIRPLSDNTALAILITCADNDVLVHDILFCMNTDLVITVMYRQPELELVVLFSRCCRSHPDVTARVHFLEFGTILCRALLSFPEEKMMLFSCFLDVLHSMESGDRAVYSLQGALVVIGRGLMHDLAPLEILAALSVLRAMAFVDQDVVVDPRYGIRDALEVLFFSEQDDAEILRECGELMTLFDN